MNSGKKNSKENQKHSEEPAQPSKRKDDCRTIPFKKQGLLVAQVGKIQLCLATLQEKEQSSPEFKAALDHLWEQYYRRIAPDRAAFCAKFGLSVDQAEAILSGTSQLASGPDSKESVTPDGEHASELAPENKSHPTAQNVGAPPSDQERSVHVTDAQPEVSAPDSQRSPRKGQKPLSTPSEKKEQPVVTEDNLIPPPDRGQGGSKPKAQAESTGTVAEDIHEPAEGTQKLSGEESLPPSTVASEAAPVIGQAPENGAVVVAAELVSVADLSKKEEALFGECEAIITENTQALFHVGEALRRIREGKLYRRDYTTFEDYCRGRWNFTKAWAYAQLKCVDVRDNLSTIGGQTQEPVNERQLRPLAALDPDQQRAAWKRAEELADGKRISSGHVGRAVKELFGNPTRKKAGAPFDPDTAWAKVIKTLKRQLKLWPTESHIDLAGRIETFLVENLNRRPVDE